MTVDIGFKLPNCGGVLCEPGWAQPETIERLALHAADCGFSSLWLHDHLLVPQELVHLERPNFFDPVVLLARIGSLVPEVTLGVATLILPFRDPVVLGKQVATLEAFLPGRIVIGVGSGRYESEFASFGSDAFRRRGKVTEEYLEVMRALRQDGPADFQGAYRSVSRAVAYPKAASGGPPIWMGGAAEVALKRAARLADGWIPASLSPADLREKRGRLAQHLEDQQRRLADFTIALSVTIRRSARSPGGTADRNLHKHTRAIVGEAEEIAEQLSAYVTEGVSAFLVSLDTSSLGDLEDQMAWCCEDVMPRVRGQGAVLG